MSRKSRFLLTVVVVVMGLLTIAGTCEPPPPPPPCGDCTPGFWKNHTEVWSGAYSAAEVVSMLADLRARGPEGRALREGVSNALNIAFPGECD